MALLEVTDLVVDYGGNRALDLPLLELQTGSLTGVVGANGAGKSTLVNALLNWSRGKPRVRGTLRLDGQDISSLDTHERVRRGIGMVPEGGGIFYRMSVEQNLRAVRVPPRQPGRMTFSIDQVLDLFPRLGERLPQMGSSLSGGERQMLSLARVLMAGPRVLLLDEPSIGLAPQLVMATLRTVRQLADQGLAVLLVEQNVRAALHVVDHIYLLERGRTVAQGDAVQMARDPRLVDAYLGGTAT